MPTSRCYNCGVPGHQTQVCPRYGPRCPEPGKAFADYAKEHERIMDLVAADILAEHLGHNYEERDEVVPDASIEKREPSRPKVALRNQIRSVTCPTCNAQPGQSCRSKNGKRLSDSHRSREEAYLGRH